MVHSGDSCLPGSFQPGCLGIFSENVTIAQPAANCYVFLPLCSKVGVFCGGFLSFTFIAPTWPASIITSLLHDVSVREITLGNMWFCCRALIYPFLIRGGKPTPFVSFALAFVFCIYNGYMQIRYLSHYAVYPAHWLTHPYFITGKW